MNKFKGIFLLSIGLLLAGSALLFAGDSGFTSFGDGASASPLSWSGTGSVHTRYMTDYNDISASGITLYPELKMSLNYKGEASEFTGSFTLSGNHDFTSSTDVADYLGRMIDEAYYRVFFKHFTLEAGLMKIVWGKGDEIFTFDNINPVDYSDFMNNSYLDRKMPEAMIKIDIPFGQQGLIEALYTPVFTPDVFPVTGAWVQKDYTAMEAIISGKMKSYVVSRTAALGNDLAASIQAQSEAASLAADTLNKEDMKTLAHGQGGLHVTDSFGGIDLGAAYEYTYLREPVVDMRAFMVDPTQKIDVTWNRLHLFGVEAATALGGFNFRAEGAYYLTEDTAGDDPVVHNNKLQYLFGFDRDLPLHNISINIQTRGEIILGSNNIKTNGTGDVEYSASDSYTSTVIAADLRDTFFNDTLTLKVSGAYSIGSKDYMLTPGLEYTFKDDASVLIKYSLFRGDTDTVFGQFKDNDMLDVTFQYSF